MSQMVDRVARAIAEEINGGKFDDDRWYSDEQRDLHRRRARAAITALLDPTDEMLVEAETVVPELASFADREDSPSFKAWQTMLRIALLEP